MSEVSELFRIAVSSDLHADEPDPHDGKVDSLFDVTEDQISQHPLAALQRLIEAERLRADVLLCGGDITNKAKPNPLQRAWPWLGKIRDALGAERLIATVGNHDLDSSHIHNDHDARGMIQAVATTLPVPDHRDVNEFWARHLCVTRVFDITFVVLNTCAFHPERQEERERGRVSKYTLNALEEKLDEEKESGRLGAINVLLCHHHPIGHPQMTREPDYGAMVRGAELLELLGRGDYGHWFIVHGHKHIPAIYYAQGSASAPLIFASGSLSARLYGEIGGRARNQFYIIELQTSLVQQYGLVGTGRAWDYAPGAGWITAGKGSGLPQQFGFGVRRSIRAVASDVAACVSGMSLKWSELCTSMPEAQFLLPKDFELLKRVLESDYALRVLESDGKPVEIGRRP